jgi:hypothetical protein
VLLIAILVKYIQTRRQLLSWNVKYGYSSSRTATGSTIIVDTTTVQEPRRSIYDRWLVLRFSIGFFTLGWVRTLAHGAPSLNDTHISDSRLFQLLTIMFEILSVNHNSADALRDAPDLSVERLRTDFLLFMPGVSASLLNFIVFGTTKTFREYIHFTFVPRQLQTRFAMWSPSFRSAKLAMPSPSTAKMNAPVYDHEERERELGVYTPTLDGRGIRLREMDVGMLGNGVRSAKDDERPILAGKPGIRRGETALTLV